MRQPPESSRTTPEVAHGGPGHSEGARGPDPALLSRRLLGYADDLMDAWCTTGDGVSQRALDDCLDQVADLLRALASAGESVAPSRPGAHP